MPRSGAKRAHTFGIDAFGCNIIKAKHGVLELRIQNTML